MNICAQGALLLVSACLASCAVTVPDRNLHAPMDAASSVSRADGGKGPRDARMIPLTPMSGDVEILYGDPEVAGQPFVIRIHELPGAIVPPHSHPVDENITVVQGTWYFALGETFDPTKLHQLPTGSYAFAPKGSSMYGFSPDGAIVQVHGVGPFLIDWHGGLHTLDDPDAGAIFRYRKGTMIHSRQGDGSIVQGYASGSIIQYEVQGADGQHFMANEDALSAR